MKAQKELYFQINKALIIKTIEELQFEEILSLEAISHSEYCLKISDEVEYRFKGKFGIWNNIQIVSNNFKKLVKSKEVETYSAVVFFQEIQKYCQMDDATFATFVEETNQTIYAEYLYLERKSKIELEQIIQGSFSMVDQLLSGHPKLLLNKGRLGWNTSDFEKYSPEVGASFQLFWVALHKNHIKLGIAPEYDQDILLRQSLSAEEITKIVCLAPTDKYFIFPVHPWQWDKYINIQFLDLIASGELLELGLMGDSYAPQASLRTLSNIYYPHKMNIKLSLSILNTSCIRGIAQKYIEVGHEISSAINKLIASDAFLTASNMKVLNEVAAVSSIASSFKEIDGASYRYKELLGCVWRESVESKLADGDMAVPVAILLEKLDEQSLLRKYIESSKLDSRQWFTKYFKHVFIPLYHLQLKYGVGLVAHGQNIIMQMKNFAPSGVIIKDFHGDLRITENSSLNLGPLSQVLDKLPSEYLIHDLITGHMVTVLRYLSRMAEEYCNFSEQKFYHLLGVSLKQYLAQYHAEIDITPAEINLLRAEFEKVLVNKVRFVAGYNETSQRLKPMLGKYIQNPIYQALNREYYE